MVAIKRERVAKRLAVPSNEMCASSGLSGDAHAVSFSSSHKAMLTVFGIVLGILGILVISISGAYIRDLQEISETFQLEKNIWSTVKSATETVTFGLYDEYSTQLEVIESKRSDAQDELRFSQYIGIGFGIIVFAGITGMYFVSRRRTDARYLFGAALLVVSTVCLVVGIFSPILAISAVKDLPVIGPTVFKFTAKGIATTIGALFSHGQPVVGVCILLFSIIIPVFKNSILAIGIFHLPLFHSLQTVLKHIGKWSMADVMVVAILLAFFAMDKDELTSAEMEIGLYFFVAYVVLSMLAFVELQHQLPEKQVSPSGKPVT